MNYKKIFFWNTITNLIAAPVRFGLNLFLASCLLPSDYGAMVLPMVIIGLSMILIDSGLKSSLIQKTTLKTEHSSTVFFVNLFISFVLGTIFSLVSLPIEYYFAITDLSWLIILASISLIFRSLSIVNEARLQIKGKYATLILIELFSYVLGYIVAIWMAKNNFGPFSLIALAMISAASYSIGLFLTERFIPRLSTVSKRLFFVHWRMGRSLLGQGLLEAFSEKIDEIILGKFIGVSSLGVYSKGREYSSTIGVIGSKFFARPWFSMMSRYSNNKFFFISKFKVGYCILLLIGVILIACNYFYGAFFINYFLGSQWMPLIPLFYYFVISTALYYLVTFNKYTFLALGLANINFKIEFLYSIIRFLMLFIIFIVFYKSAQLIILLIGIDIIARVSMLIFQAHSFEKYFKYPIKLFLIKKTGLLLLSGIVSLLPLDGTVYVSILSLIIIYLLLFLIRSYNSGILFNNAIK